MSSLNESLRIALGASPTMLTEAASNRVPKDSDQTPAADMAKEIAARRAVANTVVEEVKQVPKVFVWS